TKNLTEQIHLLERAGKSSADIQKVLGDQIHDATQKAKAMGAPIDDLIKKYTSLDKQLRDIGDTMRNVGAGLTRYVTLPLVAASALIVKSADDYHKGIEKIRIGTGATGDSLKKLTADMTAVWGTVPTGVENVGQAIADLNTRLGLTGKPLQDMATRMLELARLTGGDLTQTIAGATRLFGDWSIATDRQSSTLDYMFRVSQTTGIQMQKLLEITVQYGAPMRALGFTLEQAAVAMGKWEKEGVNMETVLAGLKYGLGQFAKAGADPVETLAAIQQAIKGAKTEAEATSIALKAFGQRAAVDLSKAIQEGRFDLVEFVKAAKEGKDTILDAAAATNTMGERMSLLKERTEKALVPLGEKLITVFETSLVPLLDNLIDKIAAAAGWFSKLDPFWQKTIIGIGGITTVAGPAISGLGQLAIAAASVSTALGTAEGTGLIARLGTGAAALGKFGLVAGGVAAAMYAAKEGLEWLGKTEYMRTKIGSGPATDWDEQTRAIVAQTKALQEEAKALGVVDMEYQKNLDYVKKMGLEDSVKLTDPMQMGTGEGWQQYHDRLASIIEKWKAAHPVLDAATGSVSDLNAAAGAAAGGGLNMLDEQLKKMLETLHSTARPADALADEMKKLQDAGAPMNEIMAAYSARLVEAAEKQKALGFSLNETAKEYMGQALKIKTQMDFEKAYQESLKLIEEQNRKLSQEAQERADKAKRDAEAAKDIAEKITDVVNKGKKEELELQIKLLEATTPRTQREAERIAQEKAGLEYRLQAEEISVKFEQQRLAIIDAISKMDTDTDAYKNAQAALEQLEIEKQKALERLNQTRTVDLAEQQRTQFEQVYKTLEDRAAGVWDAITSRGKGAFTNLADWLEGVFLSKLKNMFVNLVAQLGTGNFNIGQILGLGGGGMGAGIPGAGSWGNLLGGGMLGPGTIIPAGIMAAMSDNPYAKGLGIAGLGVAGMTGLSTLALGGGMGLWGSMMGAAFTNPFVLGGMGAILGGIALADWASGPNSMEAASKEIARDFGGVKFSDKNVEAYYTSLGITEPQAWDYRAQLNRTPVMIQQLALAAEQQGKLDDFLKSLEASNKATGSGGWGQNIRPSVELGMLTG
ncbi:MAG: phage tail tape measure protein, partial [Candidatus Paceibacterota bacterium]